MTLNIDQVRSSFPALSSGYIFADNAGGSQILKDAVDRMADYLLNTNCQLGADYSVSAQSTQRVADGSVDMVKLFNAQSVDEIVFGASSTMVMENLTRAMEEDIKPGDEFIITGEHEGNFIANGGPWKKLASRRGGVIKYWPSSATGSDNPYSVSFEIRDLIPLITAKTRIVAFTACSNILGSIVDVKDITKAVRVRGKEKGAEKVEICVDCVAYAPHRRIDVRDWEVDYCFLSLYKLYGPHISVLYVRLTCLPSLTSLAHHFLKVDNDPYKLQPGGAGYELVYASTGILPYLLSLTPSNDLNVSFEAITAHEQTLINPLLNFLTHPVQKARGVKIVGQENISPSRIPTVSFVVAGQNPIKSQDIVKVFDQRGGIGIRYGHFYAYTLVDELRPKLDPYDGVVRISLVHYNTTEEVDTIIQVLSRVLELEDNETM